MSENYTNVRLPNDLHFELKVLAVREKTTLTAIIEKLVREHLKKSN